MNFLVWSGAGFNPIDEEMVKDNSQNRARFVRIPSRMGFFHAVVRDGRLDQVGAPDMWLPHDAVEVSLEEAQRDPLLGEVVEFLQRYLGGERVSWAGRFIPEGSEFQMEVWRRCAEIPFGVTVSYGDLARMAGRPGAARAVGSAMRRNRLLVLIPCHRVIAADGSIRSVGGGIDMKRRLLRHEGVNI